MMETVGKAGEEGVITTSWGEASHDHAGLLPKRSIRMGQMSIDVNAGNFVYRKGKQLRLLA